MDSEMKRTDIIRMAQEAGIVVTGEAVWRLCELVAAAEREACAAILEANADLCQNNSMLHDILMGNAAAIRARGQA